ncbi:MAG: beta-propeller fold lactonase family protein [Verrucomicrobiota bacterium]|jgi:DNA-binding beta-propeller fold protein YncE
MRLIVPASRISVPALFVLAILTAACPLAASPDEDFAGSSDKVGLNGAGRFETPVNQMLAPAGLQVELPGMRPQALALSPDKRLLITAGQTHELVVLDPASGQILQRVPFPDTEKNQPQGPVSAAELGPDLKAQISFTGLAFSPDGSRVYMANVNGDVKVFAVQQDHRVQGLFSIALPTDKGHARAAEIPSGLAVSADGKRLYVVLNLSNRLAELDAETGRVLRLWDVGVEPYDVVLSPSKAYVSNWGGRRPDANSITGPAGLGQRVRVDPIRRVPSEGSVSIIKLHSDAPPAEILTGLHASALALSPNGRFLVVANAGSDTLSFIDTRTDEIAETISARQNPGDLLGAQPDAAAFDETGKTLFVCNGTQNAVALFHFEPGKSKLLGLAPVGWFPGAIVYDARQKSIDVANLKGVKEYPANNGDRAQFNSTRWHGSLSLVPVPDAPSLETLTRTALAAIRFPLLTQARLPARPDQAPRPVPARAGEPSLIQHVIYIIKENRTYDQVLGDVKEGNGDPSLCSFGGQITPNQHKLVHEFVLLDNTYCCGSRSPDGHQWADSAIATDYMERIYAGFPRSYPFGGEAGGEDAMAYSPAGFIWDDAIAHGKSLRDYGEYTDAHKQWNDPARKGSPSFLDLYREWTEGTKTISLWSTPNIESLRDYVATNTIGWDLDVPDVFRAAQFINDLKEFETTGHFPALVIISLPNDHTSGARPNSPTPAAQVADNDLALGRIVQAVSHSPFWKDTCLFAIEDDPQSGWDHVSGYRTTAYVASAFAKRGQVVSTQYNQTSILRTIELMLGLPPMNQMDATATPMFDCFMDTPDLTPFEAVPNTVPLDQMNPAPKRISDRLLRKDAYVSARLPLGKPDQCPDDLLNRILWRATKGPRTPYPDWAVKAGDDD